MASGSVLDLLVGLIFAAAGFALGLGYGLLLRRLLPRMGRNAFILIVLLCTMATTVLVPPLFAFAVGDAAGESLGYLRSMRWREWSMFAIEAFAAILIARRLAPQPNARVDPAVFD